MKQYLLTLMILLLSGVAAFNVHAQEDNDGKNMVKINALTLLGGKFSFEYERLLTSRISVGTAVSIRPDKALPFKDRVKEWVGDEDLNVILDGLTSSNFSVTPELRFYTSSRGPFRGFYIAPYVKYASYDAAMPFEFDVEIEGGGYDRTETIPLAGSIRAFTGGLSFGFNFKLSNSIHLDWRIIGPGYGSSKGDINGTMRLDSDEQAALREGLSQLQDELEDIALPLTIDYDVNADGAAVQILKSPWASIRSGLSISYRF